VVIIPFLAQFHNEIVLSSQGEISSWIMIMTSHEPQNIIFNGKLSIFILSTLK
jgi:hypothetical protein